MLRATWAASLDWTDCRSAGRHRGLAGQRGRKVQILTIKQRPLSLILTSSLTPDFLGGSARRADTGTLCTRPALAAHDTATWVSEATGACAPRALERGVTWPHLVTRRGWPTDCRKVEFTKQRRGAGQPVCVIRKGCPPRGPVTHLCARQCWLRAGGHAAPLQTASPARRHSSQWCTEQRQAQSID